MKKHLEKAPAHGVCIITNTQQWRRQLQLAETTVPQALHRKEDPLLVAS